jgi:chromosome segregation ATPase
VFYCRIAEVEVTIKNGGPEAFKPDQYGSSITVVRRFSKDSSSYKLKSDSGKIISTKREELSAMCEQMQLQVDNPMNVLSQGMSKLSSAFMAS